MRFLAIVSALLLSGCMGGNSTSMKGISGSQVNQTSTDNSRKDMHTSAQLAYQINNLPDSAREYIKDVQGQSNGFDHEKIVVLVDKTPLKPDSYLENRAPYSIKARAESESTLAIFNGNKGVGSSLENYSLTMTINGVRLMPLNSDWHSDRPDRLHNGGGSDKQLHPMSLQADETIPALYTFRLIEPAAGEYKGFVSIQSKDKAEILRKFKLVVSE